MWAEFKRVFDPSPSPERSFFALGNDATVWKDGRFDKTAKLPAPFIKDTHSLRIVCQLIFRELMAYPELHTSHTKTRPIRCLHRGETYEQVKFHEPVRLRDLRSAADRTECGALSKDDCVTRHPEPFGRCRSLEGRLREGSAVLGDPAG